MTNDWRELCGSDFEVDGDEVIVRFASGRTHRVAVRETDDTLELSAVVAKGAALRGVDDLALRIWRRNRVAKLVGFRQDGRGRLRGEGWVPKAGLSADEFQLVVRRVASESDRLEYLLTGRDVE